MKRIITLMLAAFILFSLAACGGQRNEKGEGASDSSFVEISSTPASTDALTPASSPALIDEAGIEYPYTFTDSLGGKVTLDKKPERVAVLFSSYADIWVTAGGSPAITVGESVERGFADSSAVLVDSNAGHMTIDLETLTEAKPDLVIGTADFECQAEAVEFCREAGIPAAAFKVEKFEDYLKVLKIFCTLTGETERYTIYGEQVKERIDSLKEAVSKYINKNSINTDILFVRSGSSAKSAKAKTADDNFACAMLEELGARNIAETKSSLTGELSFEVILEANPDYLFITTMGDENAAKDYMNSLLSSDGWNELDCVSEENYCYLPKELFHFKPNASWAEAYEYLAKVLYPELEFE